MPIFSRKSKSSQSQSVDERHNGQTYLQTSRNGAVADDTMGETVDPIVERMAIQAASRRRMNGEAPDYSITPAHRRASSNATGISAPSTVQYERRSNRGSGGNGQRKSISATSPPNGNHSEKNAREPNKSRKSSVTISLLSMETTPADPAPPKARQPTRRQDGPSPQLSRDSGYSSGARTSTTASPTQAEPTSTQDSELLYRHRRINDSLAKKKAATQARTFSLPTSQVLSNEVKPPKALSTHHKSEEKLNKATPFVSRLDPGSASSSFFASSIAPQPSSPVTPQQLQDSAQAVAAFIEQEKSRMAQTTTAPTAARSAEVATQELSDSVRKASVSTNRQENDNETVSAKADLSPGSTSAEIDRADQHALENAIEPDTQAMPNPVAERKSVARKPAPSDQSTVASRQPSVPADPSSPVDATLRASSLKLPRLPIPPPSFTSHAIHETPKESPSLALGSSRAPAESMSKLPEQQPGASTLEKETSIAMASPDSKQSQSPLQNQKPVSTLSARSINSRATGTVHSIVDHQSRLPAQFPKPAPQVEFPWISGVENDNKLPLVSVLEGFKVNRRGQVLDEEGELIGELVTGEIIHCVRRKVNAKGQVTDESGKIVGQARAVTQTPTLPVPSSKQNVPGSRVSESPMRSPISPVTSHQRRHSNLSHLSIQSNAGQVDNSNDRVPARNTLNDNTVCYELDASVESQAAPVMDHSEIFSPFAASQSRSSGGQLGSRESARTQFSASSQTAVKSAASAAGIEEPASRMLQANKHKSGPTHKPSFRSPLSGAGKNSKSSGNTG